MTHIGAILPDAVQEMRRQHRAGVREIRARQFRVRELRLAIERAARHPEIVQMELHLDCIARETIVEAIRR